MGPLGPLGPPWAPLGPINGPMGGPWAPWAPGPLGPSPGVPEAASWGPTVGPGWQLTYHGGPSGGRAPQPCVICLSGDHQSFGDHPGTKNVHDIDSMQLIRMVSEMRDKNQFQNGDALTAIKKISPSLIILAGFLLKISENI